MAELMEGARAEDGVFTTLQARAHRVSGDAVRGGIRRGVIERVHFGVFRFTSVPWSPQAMVRAAVAAGGGLAVAGYSSAAFLLGLDDTPRGRPEIVLRGSVAPDLTGVRVHRTRCLPSEDRTMLHGIACTAGHRTLIDLSGRWGRYERIERTDTAICAGVTSRPLLYRRSRALQRGRPGVSTLAEVTAPGAEGTFWSALERAFSQQVRRHELPMPKFNVPLRHHGRLLVVDALWESQQVVAELHGLRFHDRPADRLRDDERHNLMTEMGLRSLIFGWRQVHESFDEVAEQLRRALGVWV